MTELEDARDLALVRRASRGDEAAFRALIERLARVVQARVRRGLDRARQTERYDDAVQDAWLGLFRDGCAALLKWRPGGGATLEGFVGMTVENDLKNWLDAERAQKRGGSHVHVGDDALVAMADPAPSPEGRVVHADLLGRLAAHLERSLPERGLLVFRLVFTDQRTPEETARALGVTRQVVDNWLHRIRTSARDLETTF